MSTGASQTLDVWQRRFVERIEASRGSPLSKAVRDAVLRCPRHLFLSRYKLKDEEHWHHLDEGDFSENFARIYDDAPLAMVHPAGGVILSAQSKPSFVLSLLEWLDLRSGSSVLEVGSGSGWLLAVIALLVEPTGAARGIEILPELVRTSRAALDRLGLSHVEVRLGDAADGLSEGGPYDHVVFTAASPELPAWIHRDLTEQARVAATIAIPGGCDCMFVLERRNGVFHSLRAMESLSVPMTGPIADAAVLPYLSSQLGVDRAETQPSRRIPWPTSAAGATQHFIQQTSGFRAFLSITNRDFVAFNVGEPGVPLAQATLGFGLRDRSSRSLALATRDGILVLGTDHARVRLRNEMETWIAAGRPSAASFRLRVLPPGASPPLDARWHRHGAQSTFLWDLET